MSCPSFKKGDHRDFNSCNTYVSRIRHHYFYFLETIQNTFQKNVKEADEADEKYQTQRIMNFFDNTADLHITKAEDSENNGSSTPLVSLHLQNVTKEKDSPTFLVVLNNVASSKQTKSLNLLHDEKHLVKTSIQIAQSIQTQIEQAEAALESQTDETTQDDTAAATTNTDSTDRAERSSRRSRLRNREES